MVLGYSFIKPLRFECKTKKESEELQKYFFSLGIYWDDSTQELLDYCPCPVFLYIGYNRERTSITFSRWATEAREILPFTLEEFKELVNSPDEDYTSKYYFRTGDLPKMCNLEKMRFDVHANPELSEEIQKLLFVLGYTWSASCAEVKNTECDFLFASSLGVGQLSFCKDLGYFVESSIPERNLEYLQEKLRIKNAPWREREQFYFTQGYYTKLPEEVIDKLKEFEITLNPDHFVHLCEDDPTMIVYTPSEAYGEAGRYLKQKIGRYLQKYYTIEQKVLPEISNLLYLKTKLAECELHFATTREDIAEVYQNGPSSCMSSGIDDFCTDGIHPTEVYACDPIAIAYVTKKGRIVSRSVVNTKTKEWVRLYGNDELLETMLKMFGYKHNEYALEGCSLLLLENTDGQIIAPYIDGRVQHGEIQGNVIKLTQNKSMLKFNEHTNGTAYYLMRECKKCGTLQDVDSIEHYEVYDPENEYRAYQEMCPSCREELVWARYVYRGIFKQALVERQYTIFVDDCNIVKAHAGDLGYVKDHRGDYVSKSAAREYQGEWWKESELYTYRDSKGEIKYTHDPNHLVSDFITRNTISLQDPDVITYVPSDKRRRPQYSLLTYFPTLKEVSQEVINV